MKSLRNKVILSAIVLAFALIATIGSTYAWFTVSNTVNVDAMTLNVSSEDSILIMVADPQNGFDGALQGLDNLENYKTTITTSDILAYYDFTDSANSGANPWQLKLVTAVQSAYDGSVDGKTLSVMEVSDTNYTRALTAATKNANGADYIQVAFWLYNTSETSQDIVLQDFVVASDAANSASQDDIENAVRIAVWGDDSEYGSGSAGDAKIFGYTTEYAFAFSDPQLPGYYSGTPVVAGAFNALSEKSAQYATDLNNNFYAAASDATADAYETTKTNADTVFTLQSEVPTLVMVNIYVEGWSSHADNNVIAAVFDISFKFALKTA